MKTNEWTGEEDSQLLLLKEKHFSNIEINKIIPRHTIDAIRNHYWVLKKEKDNYLTHIREDITDKPKILFLDIETSLLETYNFSLYTNYIPPSNIKKDWNIICWSAEWLDNTVDGMNVIAQSQVLTPREAKAGNDKRILKELWKLLDAADLVCAHNGDSFDLKKINTRFIINGFEPPREYKTIDTLKVARKYFAFTSNKLDYINKVLGIRQKDDMQYEDWIACSEGNKEALTKMQLYNQGDVKSLKECFLKLLKWIKPPSKPRQGWKQ